MKTKEDWTKDLISKQEILHIDSTPDENYALRILQAYRVNCDTRFATSADGSCDNPLYKMMNEYQEQRAKLLDKAIEILMKNKK